MRVLIVSYFFVPEPTPRAYRTFELAREFSKRGCEVTLLIPEASVEFDTSLVGVNIIRVPSGIIMNRSAKLNRKSQANAKTRATVRGLTFKKKAKSLLHRVFPGGKSLEFFIPVSFAVNQLRGVFDLGISIGLPISTHVGFALGAMFGGPKVLTRVADYGDPFSFYSGVLFHRWMEKLLLKRFDYVTIPIDDAAIAFKGIVNAQKLRVIPQGFSFDSIRTAPYIKNQLPTFCYAGVFYDQIRNPIVFFDFLTELELDFVFVVYTRLDHCFTRSLLDKYKDRLKGRLVLLPAVNRTQLVYELSKMDFLVNFQNANRVQSPSKLIDYQASGRPVHNVSCTEFDRERFIQFLNGEYCESDINISLSHFDIVKVCDRFIELSS